MLSDAEISRIKERLRKQTDAEFDAIWDEMVRDGIIDHEGNVLKKIPEPPEWLTQTNGRTKPRPNTEKPAKKAKRSRKRS